jgi:hypothetical protein
MDRSKTKPIERTAPSNFNEEETKIVKKSVTNKSPDDKKQ